MSAITIDKTSLFDSIRRVDEDEKEYWSARDLMEILDYKLWQKFNGVIDQAIENIDSTGFQVKDHFLSVEIKNKGRGRPKKDYKLSRFACYHIALCCDSRGNDRVKAAKHYFAIKTRQAELTEIKSPQELSRLDILTMALEAEKEKVELASENQKLLSANEGLQKTIEAQAPKVIIADRTEQGIGNMTIGQFCKLQNIGRTKMFEILRAINVIQQNDVIPYQNWINQGYMATMLTTKGDRAFLVSLVTPKGLPWLIGKVDRYCKEQQIERQLELEIAESF